MKVSTGHTQEQRQDLDLSVTHGHVTTEAHLAPG